MTNWVGHHLTYQQITAPRHFKSKLTLGLDPVHQKTQDPTLNSRSLCSLQPETVDITLLTSGLPLSLGQTQLTMRMHQPQILLGSRSAYQQDDTN